MSQEQEETYTNSSTCLMLGHDDEGGFVKTIPFKRDDGVEGDIDAAAAHALGIDGERVRAYFVPMAPKKLGLAVHLYIDLQGVEHKLPHNTNATQFWLAANLPNEPPEVTPSSIHGPALITAVDMKENFVDLTPEHWEKIKEMCKEVCPSAQFLA